MASLWIIWNKADKTLLAAFAIFVLALMTHLYRPGNRFAEGFLFCAEAALVGGIADWFAVTALFRKPLGFPYHTAILPRRRDAFVKASVTMVQKEFFSRRKIFRHLERLHLLPMLMSCFSSAVLTKTTIRTAKAVTESPTAFHIIRTMSSRRSLQPILISLSASSAEMLSQCRG